MKKYTESKDGIKRATLWANTRVTPEEEREIHSMAVSRGMTVRQFLNICLIAGLEEERLSQG